MTEKIRCAEVCDRSSLLAGERCPVAQAISRRTGVPVPDLYVTKEECPLYQESGRKLFYQEGMIMVGDTEGNPISLTENAGTTRHYP